MMNTEAITPNVPSAAGHAASSDQVAEQIGRLLEAESHATDDDSVLRLLGDAHQVLLQALGSGDGS